MKKEDGNTQTQDGYTSSDLRAQWLMDAADKQSLLFLSMIAYVWLTNADPASADSLPMDHSQVTI
jgi:hypothetical protein